ncbi:MAG: hypothetical protein IIC09_00120, partial [Proteobacteria bacterium]|nr:hypothetical protein [Pseudomonadota bacterium]
MENHIFQLQYALDTFYFLVSGALVMWMAAGFSMLEAGMIRSKNTAEILTKNILLYAVACIMYMVYGYQIMYDGGAFLAGIVGTLVLERTSRPAELRTALLVGLSGPYARISCDVLSDSTAAAMAVLSVALGLGAIKALRSGSGWTLLWAGGAGLAAGAGYLTRPEAILGGPVVVVLLLSARGLGVRGRAIQIGALAVLVVAALACVVPY